MLVAKQKRQENIAEYILYLYQIEDLIRAFQGDINLIQEKLIVRYQTDEKTSAEITDWYNNLVKMMETGQENSKTLREMFNSIYEALKTQMLSHRL